MGNKKPQPEDFSEASIKKAVFSEALQHPSTLFSFAFSILSGLYMGMIDFSEPALAVAIGSGVISLIAFVYNYFLRGEKLAEKYTKDLLRDRLKYKEESAESIRDKCKEYIFNEGIKAYSELLEAHTRLSDFLKEKEKNKKSFTISKFRILADETFYGGISLIGKGAELYNAIRNMQEGKLENEFNDWTDEYNDNKRTDKKEQELLKLKIDNHEKRLSLLKKRKSSLVEIMDQVEVLESTLDSTYLEVLDLLESDTISSGDKLVSGLQKAVRSARKVEDRLRGNRDDDDIYKERE